MDRDQPHIKALYVEGEYIKDTGESQKLLDKYMTSDVEVIDLDNKTVIPGFNDSHLHLYQFALSNSKISLHQVKTYSDIKELILTSITRRKLKTKSEQWIEGLGWHEKNFSEPLRIDKKLLDSITNEHPIILKRICFHLAVANSRALQIAGINERTPDPAGGKISRSPDGKPDGLLYDSAIDLIEKKIGKNDKEEIQNLLLSAFPQVLEKGITSIQTDDFLNINRKSSMIDSYQELLKQGLLPLRVNLQLRLESREEIIEYAEKNFKTGHGSEYLKYGPVKIIYDGSLGARTAALIEGYHDSPENRGELLLTQKELDELVITAHRHGFQLAVHTIGDASLRNTLRSFRKMLKTKPDDDARPIIIHAQIANLELFKKMKELGVVAAIQPSFLATDWPILHDRIGMERSRTSYAWNTMWKEGIVLSGSSDSPIEPIDPLLGIHAAVTRQDREDKPEEGWYPKEKLSVKQAVQLYTCNSAYQSFEEDIKGSLTKNKVADFIVLSENIFTIDIKKIKDVKVEKTYLGGKLVYQR